MEHSLTAWHQGTGGLPPRETKGILHEMSENNE